MLTVLLQIILAHHSLKEPGVQRAASIPWWGGKNLFDQILPSRAVNQSPRNASFHKSCSCSTSQVPKHHPTSQSREKNLPNGDPPALSWLQGLTPKQDQSQLPLCTSVLVTHLEGIKCILLGEERSSECSGAALPAGGCSTINGCIPEGGKVVSFGMRSGEQELPATPMCPTQHTKAPDWGLVHTLRNLGKAPKWEIIPQNRVRGKKLFFPLGPDCWGIHRDQNVGKEEQLMYS